MKTLLVAINAKYIHSNLALYSLKAYADKFCHSQDKIINIKEYTINNELDEILHGIYEEKPDILAFSCYIWNIEYVCKLLVEIKKILPRVCIILGGPEASYSSESLLEKYPQISLIIKGEGEETFKEVVDTVSENTDESAFIDALRKVDGIATHQFVTANRAPMDMSRIPFPYKDLKEFENRIIYYESSRGCPFSCSYCLSSIDKSLRFRDITLVEKELQFFIDHNIKQVKFVDRTFNIKKSHAMSIWKYILENDNGVTNFHFEIAADLIDEDALELFKLMRPDLIQLEIGIQSVNADTIAEIKRKMDIDKVRNVIEKINTFGNIRQHVDLIAGLPKEDLKSFIHSFNTVYRYKPDELQLGFLKILAGSYMYDMKDNYEISYRGYPPYEVLCTKWMSYEDICVLKTVEDMVECYYNSGQFAMTLAHLENYFEEPFEMFYEIGKYYEMHFGKEVKHSRIARYNILKDFYEERIENGDMNMMLHCLTMDVYLRENAKKRPDYSKDMGEYRKLIKEYAKEAKLNRSEHIEVIEDDVYIGMDWKLLSNVEFLEDFVLEGAYRKDKYKYLLIFDYDYKHPLTHQCRVKVVKVIYDEEEC